MQALFSHYQVGRFFSVFAASCLEALHIVYDAAHPYAALTWRILSSPEALALYRFLWRSLLALIALIALLAFTAGGKLRAWCDRFVEERLIPEAVSGAMTQIEAPLALAAPVDLWSEPLEAAPVLPPLPVVSPIAPMILALPPAQVPVVTVEAKQPQKRGRPKGSKNKAKALAAV